MNFKLFTITQIISLLCIINASTNTSNILVLNTDRITQSYKDKNLMLELQIETTLKDYLQITVNKIDLENSSYIIEYYENENQESRIQLSYTPASNNSIWLTKEQVSTGNYIKISCLEDNCNYCLTLENKDDIYLDLNSEYTYYVPKINSEMIFNFNINKKENSYIEIWIIGAKNNVEIEGDKISEMEENEKKICILTTKEDAKAIVPGNVGDLVTVGSRIITNSISESILVKNNPEIYGFQDNTKNISEICYPFDPSGLQLNENDLIYISIRIFNGFGMAYFLDSYKKSMNLTLSGNDNYKISVKEASKTSFCVYIPEYIETIFYELTITSDINQKNNILIYKPKKLGEFYPRMISEDSISGFIGKSDNQISGKIKYNVISTLGSISVNYMECNMYPLCLYDEMDNTKEIVNINSLTSYFDDDYDKDITAISPKQNILFVKCLEGDKEEGESNIKGTCQFNIITYSENDSIHLSENQIFYQYILSSEIDKFTISFAQEKDINLYKLLIDLMIFSGDVNLQSEKKEEEIHKYQTANKIFYSISLDKLNYKEMNFNVLAQKNSFYSIQYKLIRENRKYESFINTVPTGVNFLLTIDPYDSNQKDIYLSKYIYFNNKKSKEDNSFLFNFYSLNCEIEISKYYYESKQETLNIRDYYFSQDIITKMDERYNQDIFSYIATIYSMEQGTYDKKMCMLYASSLELEANKSKQKAILISEDVPQKVFFEKENKVMKYLYYIPNTNNHLGIRFIFNDKSKYNIKYYINNHILRNMNINSNKLETIKSSDYSQYCPKNQPCSLIIEIENLLEDVNNIPILEVTIKSIGITEKYPSYLTKNKVINDYLNNISPNYYYTDIGESISGEVIINYRRGNGVVFGKIVKKNQENPDKNPEWRGIYEFPNTVDGTLQYTSYLRRLIFTEEDTEECKVGCYLLLSVKSAIISDMDSSMRYFSFDILIKTQSKIIESNIPVISIPLDNYIIGNIDNEDEDSKTFYMVYIPYDSEKVIFDFQSEYASFYVNVFSNENRFNNIELLHPTKKKSNWKFYSKGRPSLYEISKTQILDAAKNFKIIGENATSIAGLNLAIGIYSEILGFSTSIYSINVQLSIDPTINLHVIESNQQALCNSSVIENESGNFKYQCLYVIKYDNTDLIYNLLMYPTFEDESAEYKLYADYIQTDFYDLNNIEELKKNIPKENVANKTENGYLSINLNKTGYYIYVNIVVDKPTIIKLLTTFDTKDYTASPNPSSPQLYIVENKELEFNFSSRDELMLNFESVYGNADIYWKDEEKIAKYTLIEQNDKLSLISPHSTNESKKKNTLIIKNLNPDDKGFIFYMSFYPRSHAINLDELNLGKTFKLNYGETDFPINIYVKLDNIKDYVNTFINLNRLDIIGENNNEEEEFQIMAWVLKDSNILEMKNGIDLTPSYKSAIKGNYDPSKRIGLITIKNEDMIKLEIGEEESPNLLITIDKNIDSENTRKYNRISLEGAVMQDNLFIPITERVYQHGKLNNDSEKLVFKLRTDKSKDTMVFFFSSNSDKLEFKISKDKDKKELFKFDNSKDYDGRTIVSFKTEPDKYNYIYLTISLKDNKSDENLRNYAFKYINVKDPSKVDLYELHSKDIEFSQQDSEMNIKVEAVKCPECKVIYFVKFIWRDTLIKEEKFNNIAVIESKGLVKEYENIKSDGNNKVTLNTKGIEKDFAYIQVIAQITKDSTNEYISYNDKYFEKHNASDDNSDDNSNDDSDDEKKKLKIALIIVACFCFILIVLIIVIVIKCNKENKNLMDKINNISFKFDNDNNNEKETDNKNLLADD